MRNIILCLGDGMGLPQIAVTRIATRGVQGRLHLERLPVTGLVSTHTLDDLVTSSDAGATALATGLKTRNKLISVTPDGDRLKTILEAAKDLGKATGLVTTTMINDATPAAFAAHVMNRYDLSAIAEQLLGGHVDVLLGNGRESFIPKSAPGSAREDELDLISKAKADGYAVVGNRDELTQIQATKVLGLFRSEDLTAAIPTPSLAELTAKAIGLLNRNDRGFFLMIEQEGIDENSHRNQVGRMVESLGQFDEAVKLAVEFALQDRHSLVVVTGDHETGGLILESGRASKPEMQVAWLTTLHTGQPVPLFAFGPHAMRFTGLKDNTEVPRLFAELLGVKLSSAAGKD